jgi:hypothetical protein
VIDNAAMIRFDFLAATSSRYYGAVAVGIWTANWEMGCKARGITGRWAFLDPTTVGAGELPRYDISWLLNPPLKA